MNIFCFFFFCIFRFFFLKLRTFKYEFAMTYLGLEMVKVIKYIDLYLIAYEVIYSLTLRVVPSTMTYPQHARNIRFLAGSCFVCTLRAPKGSKGPSGPFGTKGPFGPFGPLGPLGGFVGLPRLRVKAAKPGLASPKPGF